MTSSGPDRDEFLSEFTQLISHLPVRDTARRSGWSRSTVSELRSGQRLPNPDQLQHLLIVAGINTDEIERWQQRLAAITPIPTTAADNQGATTPPTLRSATPRPTSTTARGVRFTKARLVLTIALVGALLATGFLTGRLSASTGRAPGPSTYTVTIANTANLGVDIYTGPSRAHHKAGAIAEGVSVRIVCQNGGAETVTDRVGGRTLSWPVWDELADGFWVPDIYTSTSKSYTPDPGRTALLSC